MTVATLKIVDADCAGGFRIVNASDFDPVAQTLFDVMESPEPDAPGEMRLVDIKAQLIALEIAIPRNASKATCLALLADATKAPT